MFTVRSVSDEGIYYLVNHWQKHKRFWVSKDELKRSMLFSRKQDAKTSLKKTIESDGRL